VSPSHRRSLPIPITTTLGRLRTFLESVAKRRSLITYRTLPRPHRRGFSSMVGDRHLIRAEIAKIDGGQRGGEWPP
jgi:hypothetical protein